jgi:Family of unknown function (DUF6152)
MFTNWRLAAMTTGLVLLQAGTLVAHHSFSSEYDGQKTFKISGVVTKVEWTNPHVRFYVDVKDADGTVATWNLELASPSALLRNGWSSRATPRAPWWSRTDDPYSQGTRAMPTCRHAR